MSGDGYTLLTIDGVAQLSDGYGRLALPDNCINMTILVVLPGGRDEAGYPDSMFQ